MYYQRFNTPQEITEGMRARAKRLSKSQRTTLDRETVTFVLVVLFAALNNLAAIDPLLILIANTAGLAALVGLFFHLLNKLDHHRESQKRLAKQEKSRRAANVHNQINKRLTAIGELSQTEREEIDAANHRQKAATALMTFTLVAFLSVEMYGTNQPNPEQEEHAQQLLEDLPELDQVRLYRAIRLNRALNFKH